MKGRRVILGVLLFLAVFHASISSVLASNIGSDAFLKTYDPEKKYEIKPILLPPSVTNGSGSKNIQRDDHGVVIGSPYANIPDSELSTEEIAAKYGTTVGELATRSEPSTAQKVGGFFSNLWSSITKSVKSATISVTKSVSKVNATTTKFIYRTVSTATRSITQKFGQITQSLISQSSTVIIFLQNSFTQSTKQKKYYGEGADSLVSWVQQFVWQKPKNDYIAELTRNNSLDIRINYSRDKQVLEVQKIIVNSLKGQKSIRDYSTSKDHLDKLLYNLKRDDQGNLFIDTLDSKLSTRQLRELNESVKHFVQMNKKELSKQENTSTRLFLNSIYIRNLRSLSYQKEITSLDGYAQSSDFIAQYYGSSKVEVERFHKDFTIALSNRPGTDCLWSGPGCYSSSDAGNAFSVYWFKGSGFNPILSDDKYEKGSLGNVIFHTTGLGINFGFVSSTNNCIWGFVNAFPYIQYRCMSAEAWGMFHETNQSGKREIDGKAGSSYEDLFASIVGVQLGRDLQERKITPQLFGAEIRKRMGKKSQYDICKDLVSKVPKSDLWNEVSCQDVNNHFKNLK